MGDGAFCAFSPLTLLFVVFYEMLRRRQQVGRQVTREYSRLKKKKKRGRMRDGA